VLFSSLSYPIFLWTVFVVWWALRERRTAKHWWLLGVSYWFYWTMGGWPLLLLGWTTLIDWWIGLRVQQSRDRDDLRSAKRWMLSSMVSNLAVLAVFKYYDFFAVNVQAALGRFGVDVSPPLLDLLLPVGISFYTFGSMSYVLDVWRGTFHATRSLLDFATFVAFFPHLTAGPIVRARDFLPQMDAPKPPDSPRLANGLLQILEGLAKKLLIADVLGAHMVDPIFRDPARLAALDVVDVFVLGLGFLVQVYGDFAGYTDVAIGSARVLGFDLRPNFNAPLKATSIFDFWDRWHISMSNWFRDYVFAPMVGRQASLLRACLSTLATLTLVGIWHGAAWTFFLFGVIHGVVMSLGRVFRKLVPMDPWRRGLPWQLSCQVATIAFVCLTVLLYRATSVGQWQQILRGLGNWSVDGLDLPWQVWTVLAAGVVTQLLPEGFVARFRNGWMRSPAVLQAAVIVAAAVLFFGLRPPGAAPFIYFQF
jgi:alginate O-acetyltransferase complex protein AlgI